MLGIIQKKNKRAVHSGWDSLDTVMQYQDAIHTQLILADVWLGFLFLACMAREKWTRTQMIIHSYWIALGWIGKYLQMYQVEAVY